MGCSSAQQVLEESPPRKIDSQADTSIIIDKISENFFSSKIEKEELNAFLVTTKFYDSKKEILISIINGKILEIYSDYEKCKEASKKDGRENEFLIVSEDFMKNNYKGFDLIEDKKTKIKKNLLNYEIYFENHNNYIRFQKSKNELFSFINVDNEVNLDSNIRKINKQKYHNFSKEKK